MMFENLIEYALYPVTALNNYIKPELKKISFDTVVKATTVIATSYVYYDTFTYYFEANTGFYYSTARAAGAVLKYTLPFIFLPTLRMYNNKINEIKYLDIFAKQVDRYSFHKFIASSMLFFSSVHTGAHIANRFGQINLFEQEWLTGAGMLGICSLPITAMYLASSKLSNVAGYYLRFLLPHQLGWWGLLSAFAYHTRDLRLLPISGTIFAIFSMDRLYEWYNSFNAELVNIERIHDGMALIYFNKPKGFKFNPGDYVQLAYPWFNYFINAAHPFTIAGAEDDKHLKFLISSKGQWTQSLINDLPLGTKIRITPPFVSPLNHSFANTHEVILMSSGSGMAMTLSFLNYFKQSGKHIDVLSLYHSTREIAEIKYLLNLVNKDKIKVDNMQFNLTTQSDSEIKDPRIIKKRYDPSQDKYFKQFKGHIFFCGSPELAKSLKGACQNDTDKELHIENFSI